MNNTHEVTLTDDEIKAILDLISICEDEEFCLAEELYSIYERLNNMLEE